MNNDPPPAQFLKPEWWKHPLPRAIGHEKNFVMTLPQMKVYEAVLQKMHDVVEKEWISVRRGVQVLERRHLSPWGLPDPPRPVTLNRVLSILVEEANFHLLLLQTSIQLMSSNQTRKEKQCTDNGQPTVEPGSVT